MKKHSPISFRQLLFGLCFLLVFSGMTLFLFSWQRDEKRFANMTASLFTNEMKSNTLNMHYTLANPEDFGIYQYEPVLACYDAAATLQSQAEAENTLAALYALHPEKLSEEDAWLWRLRTFLITMNRFLPLPAPSPDCPFFWRNTHFAENGTWRIIWRCLTRSIPISPHCWYTNRKKPRPVLSLLAPF